MTAGLAPLAGAPLAALALPLVPPAAPPPLVRGGEPRGAVILVELEVYVGPRPGEGA